MKKVFALIFSVLAFTAMAAAQNTVVSATVVDSDGTVWAGGTWNINFKPNPSQPNPNVYNINGVPLSHSVIHQHGSMDGSGIFSVTVYQNTVITPVGSSWDLTVCPQATAPCGSYNFTTSTSTLDISAALTAIIPAPRFQPLSGTYGYADIEAALQLLPGSTYWNVTASQQHCYNGSSWLVCSGSGSGTVAPSPQYQLPYFDQTGSQGHVKGATGVTTNGIGSLTFHPSAVSQFPSLTGDAGAAINTEFLTNNLVIISTATSPVATTTITIPNAATGLNGIAGTLRILGSGTITVPQILFQDSTTTAIQSGVLDCPDHATIKLAASSNKALISDTNFATLTGTTNAYGVLNAKINGCILDGNKANNASGWGVQLYGRKILISKADVQNAVSGGFWLENHDASSFTNPEDDDAQFGSDLRAIDNGGDGIYVPQGQGWAFKNLIAWGNTGWGLHTKSAISASVVNTYENSAGGCYIDTGGGLYGTNTTCSSASGAALLIGTSAEDSVINGSFGCNGCIGVEIESSGQKINGFIGNSAQAIIVNGGSVNGSFTVGDNSGALLTLISEASGSFLSITGSTQGNSSCISGTPAGNDTLFIQTSGISIPCSITQLPTPTVLIANNPSGWLQLLPNSGTNLLESGTSSGAGIQNFEIAGPSSAQLNTVIVNAAATQFTGVVNVPPGSNFQINGVNLILAGTTGSIGGSALALNACASGTATVTGATTGMVAVTNPASDPNSGTTQDYDWYARVTSAGTVTVYVCAIVAGTPIATTYNVRVIQ